MIKIVCSEKDLPVDEKSLFNVGFVFSHIINKNNTGIIEDTSLSTEEKVRKIMGNKEKSLKTINEIDENKLLSMFSHDGGIKITVEDIEEIIGSLYLVGEDVEGGKKRIEILPEEHPFIQALVDDFCYFGAETLNFRNKNYYFLYDSLSIGKIGKSTSINDFDITDIDFLEFKNEIYRNYNRIDQHLKMFLDFFSGYTNYNIMEKYEDFSKEINELFSTKKLETIKNAITKINNSPDENFNKKTKEDLLNLVSLIEELVEMVNKINLPLDLKNDYHRHLYLQHIDNIVKFIAFNNVGFNNIKNILKLDIDDIFRKYVYAEIPNSLKKVVLGMIDAKINILAFMQNMTQILFNENFFNPNFDGNLVLRKDQLEYIKKVNPDLISEFKKFQAEIIGNNETNRDLAIELDANIGYFIDILIGDKPESYIYATTLLNQDLKEIDKGNDDSEVKLFYASLELFGKLLEQIEKFGDDLDEKGLKSHEKEVKKAEKKGKELPPIFQKGKNVNFLDSKRNILKKLIRLHREENHPVVMINTAQNAYNHTYENGRNNNDSLHLLSVNYGGSLVGYYAKHTFERLHGENILINLGNIVYSIYDLKNASDFLKIVDYPFVEYMEQFSSGEMKSYLSNLNHAIIFDDNTCSGRTLNNLANLTRQSGYYGKVDIFACRVSQRLEGYDASVIPETILNLIKNASFESRKTKVGQVKRNYKELIGTVIGRDMYYSWGKAKFKINN
ncbi:MAG: hypothetical protein PHV23_06125 [Candidatus Gracilibacteria bacterium]|nr:hypothetical protein [Candidatus Gracilibacteria bacterium]